MAAIKVIDVNVGVTAENDRLAEQIRKRNLKNHTLLINMMASPGAGKTTLILKTAETLRKRFTIGVMEADIDAEVDAEKMAEAGLKVMQVHTGGECAMDAAMTGQALDAFDGDALDMIFLENVGNLVCPAEQDTGASLNVEILSIPEGDDKPLKYPLMFEICDIIIVSKIDTRAYFDFDDDAFCERARRLNPDVKIFFLSAKTGDGMDEWIDALSCLAGRVL